MGALAALGLLAGCGRTQAEPVTLSGLQDRTLQFTLTDVDSLERTSAAGSHRFTLTFSAGSSCIRLVDGVTASLNGQLMKLEPGGVPDTGVGGREVCELPRATFDFDPTQWAAEPTEDLHITLQDDTHVMRLVLQHGKAKRRLVRTSGSSSTLRRGQTHPYVWQPDTDTLPELVQASLIPLGGGAAATLTVQQSGNAVGLVVPSGTVEGPYTLRLSGTAQTEVSTCEGVARCEGAVFHSEDVDVSVL